MFRGFIGKNQCFQDMEKVVAYIGTYGGSLCIAPPLQFLYEAYQREVLLHTDTDIEPILPLNRFQSAEIGIVV